MRLDEAMLATDLAYQQNLPMMAWGPPGVGKSSMFAQYADMKKLAMLDWRLTEYESVDLRGTPRERNGHTYWAPPEELPLVGNGGPDEGIILLDELPQAKMDVKNVAARFVLERRIGEARLKPGWRIFAAGNRLGDAAGTSPMPTHLNNRFWHVEIEASIEAWIHNYADPRNVDPRIVAYLKYKPEALLAFDPRSKEAAFASPRSWVTLSNMLAGMKGRENSIDAAVLGEYVSGNVGRQYGMEFAAFLRTMLSLVSIEQILLDPQGVTVPSEPSICYALATALAVQVNRNSIDAAFKYTQRMSKEFAFVFAHKVKNMQPALCKTKAWVTFTALNADFV